jgi:hypothetical protein
MPHPLTKRAIPIGTNPRSCFKDTSYDHQCEWQRHVDAGRIGERPRTDRKILTRHARNELIVLGEYRVPIW